MTELKRLVLDFRTGELVIRTLYRTEGEADPNTKARRREVTEISREGLSTALEALEGRVDVVETSGFTTRTVPRRNVRPRGAWATTLGAVQGLEQRIRRLKRELRELREEA